MRKEGVTVVQMGLGGGETGGRRGDSGDVEVDGSDGGGEEEDEARKVRVDAAGKALGWRWARGAGMAYTVMVFSWSAAQHQQGMSRYHEQAQSTLASIPSKSLIGKLTVCGNTQVLAEDTFIPFFCKEIASSIATTETVQDSPILSRAV